MIPVLCPPKLSCECGEKLSLEPANVSRAAFAPAPLERSCVAPEDDHDDEEWGYGRAAKILPTCCAAAYPELDWAPFFDLANVIEACADINTHGGYKGRRDINVST